MYNREILANLKVWKNKKNRKPLIISGARQVGKTSVIDLFDGSFKHYISLNLDLKNDIEIFSHGNDVNKIIKILFLRHNIPLSEQKETLLFIDEIQNSASAIASLRYFYEQVPGLYVIAAGSMLESIFDTKVNFPVGRIEYLAIRPFSFTEYLNAAGEEQSLNIIKEIPFPDYGHRKLLSLFKEYTLIGGMPEVISVFPENRDLVMTNQIYQFLITAYLDDVEKYASGDAEAKVIRHVINNVIKIAGERIKFAGFGLSNYKSKEIGQAFRIPEKALLLQLVYPTTNTKLPLIENKKKSPKIQFLDTGIINNFSGVQSQLLSDE
jgi:uncharacterized protein